VFLIGALAKMGATLVTYPLLLIKSRLMSASASTRADLKYSGTVDALVRIYKADGGRLFLIYSIHSISATSCLNA